jgi:predicted Zn-dependent peptidase
LYAKTGASANAFTSFDRTAYLFNCTANFKENLKILLEFVQSPHFTQETVDKEQGIIGQEIQMTNDQPGWKVFFNLLDCLYVNHPVKIDIAGTKESIAKIDANLLYKCYNTFYNLNNMVLSVAGNITVEDVLEIADKCLKPCEDLEIETVFPEEPPTVNKKSMVHIQPVGLPLFQIGYKIKPFSTPYEVLKAEIISNIIINILTDTASSFYKNMSDRNLLNSSFECEIFSGDSFFCIICSGESADPYMLYDELNKTIENAQIQGLDKKHFEALRKSEYGAAVKAFNNVNNIAEALLNNALTGYKTFDCLQILRDLTYDEVSNFFKTNVNTQNSAISIVHS